MVVLFQSSVRLPSSVGLGSILKSCWLMVVGLNGKYVNTELSRAEHGPRPGVPGDRGTVWGWQLKSFGLYKLSKSGLCTYSLISTGRWAELFKLFNLPLNLIFTGRASHMQHPWGWGGLWQFYLLISSFQCSSSVFILIRDFSEYLILLRMFQCQMI